MKKLIYILFVFGLVSSCADLEDVSPINSVTTDIVFKNGTTVQAVLNGMYSNMQAQDFDTWLSLPQYFSDEANATGTFPTRLEFGNLNVFPANGTMASAFTNLYGTINIANNIIAKTPAIEDKAFSDAAKADVIAQAKFIRAFCYLHLVTLWNEVPLVTEPTEGTGDALRVAKKPASEVYALVVSDLQEALSNLSNDSGRFHPSKQSAAAMLARTNLYMGNYSEAQSFAESALGSNFDLTDVPFLSDQIFSLGYSATDGNTLNFFYGPSSLGGRFSIGPSNALLNAFEAGDLRFDRTIAFTGSNQAYGIKYPTFSAGISGTATDPIMFIRHAEMVLILAETYARSGDFDTANAYFNQVRARAGLAPITLDSSNFIDFILRERFVEFAFEGAQRLIDLRRTGNAEAYLGGIGYDACDSVWPLPQREIDRNPNLQQNGCCNC